MLINRLQLKLIHIAVATTLVPIMLTQINVSEFQKNIEEPYFVEKVALAAE